jgi:hypothetical protein
MSAIASFVLDCARTGRWVRGLMALQGHINSTDAATRQACVAVAQVAAAHSWAAALSLLHPMDVVRHTAAVCKTIDTVARHPRLSIHHYESAIAAMLQGVGAATQDVSSSSAPLQPSSSSSSSNAQLQRKIFLSATLWCSAETAGRLLKSLPSSPPPPQTCVARVRELQQLRHCILHDVGPFAQWANDAGHVSSATRDDLSTDDGHQAKRSTELASRGGEAVAIVESMEERLRQLEATPAGSGHRRYTARDRRELARLKVLQRRSLLTDAQEAEAALVHQAFTAVAPSAQSICAALRVMTRPTTTTTTTTTAATSTFSSSSSSSSTADISRSFSVWALVESSRLPLEVALLYARAVGLVCPWRWAKALTVLQQHIEARNDGVDDGGAKDKQRVLRLTRLWLLSRGSWTAALQELRLWSDQSTPVVDAAATTQLALDMLQRTALPPHVFYRMHPQTTRPWYRLSAHRHHTAAAAAADDVDGDAGVDDEPVSRRIAQALARGVRLDEVQLSVAGKAWAAQGRWENALHLYYRFPRSEFQKYATRSLVTARPALPVEAASMESTSTNHRHAVTKWERGISTTTMTTMTPRCAVGIDDDGTFNVMMALQLLVPADGIRYCVDAPSRPAPSLETFPATQLIGAAANWVAALSVFRGCIRSGTRCSPHLLSSLLQHADFPPQALRRVLGHYPAAVNNGVRRRAKEAFGIELP